MDRHLLKYVNIDNSLWKDNFSYCRSTNFVRIAKWRQRTGKNLTQASSVVSHPVSYQWIKVDQFTSGPVCMLSDNQQNTEAVQDETSFQQVVPNIPQQSLFPSLVSHHLYLHQYLSLEKLSMTQRNTKEESSMSMMKVLSEGLILPSPQFIRTGAASCHPKCKSTAHNTTARGNRSIQLMTNILNW